MTRTTVEPAFRFFRMIRIFLLFLFLGSVLPGHSNAADAPRRLFFLHHSTGRNLLEEGDARQILSDLNDARGSDLVLWDHDYNYIGLSDQDGDQLGYHYGIPDDDTYPEGLHTLWTTPNAARDSLLARYDIIAFKSCYPTCDIDSEAQLQQYKDWYLDMRDFFDTRPDKIFIIMSPPPRHRLSTNSAHADRARRFASWMTGADYLNGHPNLVGFDFFDRLARPDDGSPQRNTLRYAFERSHSDGDSHPNALANETVAPFFVETLVEAAQPSSTSAPMQTSPFASHRNHPNPFNPSTVIAFTMEREGAVALDILDARGVLVRHLHDGHLAAGRQEKRWDGKDDLGRDLGSGLYFYRLRQGTAGTGGKMLLVR